MKALIIGAVGLGLALMAVHAEPGMEVLTRGPVHEAYAGFVTYNPEPGPLVPKVPPAPIEELPPTERPMGQTVVWIPGYWAWDDERDDFLWVSGIWRVLPPARQWVSGYWAQNPNGYQWVSGYWGDARVNATTYMPVPPATLEAGPNTPAPSADYVWVPGCWVWHQGRYAWRPGYWLVGRTEWDWVPASYAWTPRGYVFVDGYWDYAVDRRGVLFAPVYFAPTVVVRHYTPAVVIQTDVFAEHLFLRPRYRSYYFGDYYAASYYSSGFFFSFNYFGYRHCYDTIQSRRRWQHRHERDWQHRSQATYQQRRDNEADRPPRTWAAQQKIARQPEAAAVNVPTPIATSLENYNRQKPRNQRLQVVPEQERQKIVEREPAVQRYQEDRRVRETRPPVEPPSEPKRVTVPRSPITSRPGNPVWAESEAPRVRRGPEPVTPAPQQRAPVQQAPPKQTAPVAPPATDQTPTETPSLRRDRSSSQGSMLERRVDEPPVSANNPRRVWKNKSE